MHNRGYRRHNTIKAKTKRIRLAEELGKITDDGLWDAKHIGRLANNGWSCNCWLCKPYRKSNRAVIKRDLIDRIYKEEIRDEF